MEARILITGSEGCGKHCIASQISDMGESLNLKVHTSVETSNLHRAGTQFICFMMRNSKESMDLMKNNVLAVKSPHILERSAILVNTNGVNDIEKFYQTMISGLKEELGVLVLFCNTEVESERVDVCRRLIRLIQTSTGRRKIVSPLVYEAVGAGIQTERAQIMEQAL